MAVEYGQQKEFWEARTGRRAPTHPAVVAFARPKLDFVTSLIPSGLSMLEVGAGNGYLSETFSNTFDLTVVDFSENMLRMHPMPDDRKVLGDADDLPFDADAFEVVFCANLLHHLEDPRVAVSEMKRVASRFVVLLEPNILNPLMFAFCALKPEERGAVKFTPAYLRALGAGLNLRLVDSTSLGAVLPNKTPSIALPLLKRFDRRYPVPIGFYNIAVFAK